MELTPEAQAVIDAVLIEHDRIGMTSARIIAAIDAYQASIKPPPEPFTRYMALDDDCWNEWAMALEGWHRENVWEVLITPVRKVR